MTNDLETFVKKISDPNLNQKITTLITPKVKELFKKSVKNAIEDFYSSYHPIDYIRTDNFESVIYKSNVTTHGSVITMTANNNAMSSYPGWMGQPLDRESAFNMFYMNGFHGYDTDNYGVLLRSVSTPPHIMVRKDVDSGFNGEINNCLQDALDKILG